CTERNPPPAPRARGVPDARRAGGLDGEAPHAGGRPRTRSNPDAVRALRVLQPDRSAAHAPAPTISGPCSAIGAFRPVEMRSAAARKHRPPESQNAPPESPG